MNQNLCQTFNVDFNNQSLKAWLQQKGKEYQLNYLLAHAEDGVIWGKFKPEYNYKLIISGEVFNQLATLRIETLQQCRIFSQTAEVMLWKNSQIWKGRLIQDEHLSEEHYICENQILWGTQAKDEQQGFTLVSDGSQGLKHAVPLTGIVFNSDKRKPLRPLRLTVHHYIDYDDSGIARINLSRLVNLFYN